MSCVRQGEKVYQVDLEGVTHLVASAATSISTRLWTDSRVRVSEVAIAVALLQDMRTNGDLLPTEEQCEMLVAGEDREQRQLRATFPNTNRLLYRALDE